MKPQPWVGSETLRTCGLALAGLAGVGNNDKAAVLLASLDAIAEREGAEATAARLGPISDELPLHPLLAEHRARLLRASEQHHAAAESVRASRPRVTRRRAPIGAVLCSSAFVGGRTRNRPLTGCLRGMRSFGCHYKDVYERMRTLLEGQHATERLADLTKRRIDAGAPSTELLKLHEVHAHLREQLGDRTTARKALKAALDIEPTSVESLHQLAKLSCRNPTGEVPPMP